MIKAKCNSCKKIVEGDVYENRDDTASFIPYEKHECEENNTYELLEDGDTMKKENRFEKQFPILIQWSKKKDKSIGPIETPIHMKGHIYYWNEIMAGCVDKQRVKEVFDDEPTFKCDTRLHNEAGCPKCRVFKKLGIE